MKILISLQFQILCWPGPQPRRSGHLTDLAGGLSGRPISVAQQGYFCTIIPSFSVSGQ